jgi:hypothetical protein
VAKSGWLERQMNKNVKDVKKWPAWMREGAIKLDPPESRDKEDKRSSCASEAETKKNTTSSS